jgi:arginine deiminase
MNDDDVITPEHMAHRAMQRQLDRQQRDVDHLVEAVNEQTAELVRLHEDLAKATAMRDACATWLADNGVTPYDPAVAG